jgi:hypothetical protein
VNYAATDTTTTRRTRKGGETATEAPMTKTKRAVALIARHWLIMMLCIVMVVFTHFVIHT